MKFTGFMRSAPKLTAPGSLVSLFFLFLLLGFNFVYVQIKKFSQFCSQVFYVDLGIFLCEKPLSNKWLEEYSWNFKSKINLVFIIIIDCFYQYNV